MKVLLIEDNAPTRLLLSKQLQILGEQVLAAESVEQAVRLMRQGPVDLVLMDWHLGEGDGETLVRTLKFAAGQSLKVVVITASDPDSIPAAEAGVDEVLKKPISGQVLRRLLGKLDDAGESVAAASDRGAFDPRRIQELQEMAQLAGPSAVDAIVRTFFEASEKRLVGLDEAIETGACAEIKRICHGWKGISASLGAVDLALALQECEQSADLADVSRCRGQLDGLREKYGAARTFLEDLLAPREAGGLRDND